ncbi:MAG: restriction endonuclease subunit S [Desulfobacteraceae bacterium]|nr:restriction endonuclease subunit S [Desulfobacteraceae bacterium]
MDVQIKKLSQVALINPRRPSIERSDDELTSFVPMENVDDVQGEILRLNSEPYSKVKKGYTYFENGDVIFAKITPCMQNGKHAVLTGLKDGFGFGSTEFHVIRTSDEVIPEWIHFYLLRKETLDSAMKTFTGTVGQQRVPACFLENLEIPILPIENQRQIAARLKAQLAEVEKARKAAEIQLDDVRLLRSFMLETIFSELDSAPRKKIGDKADTTSGSTPARGQKSYWEPAEIPWVKTAEVAFVPIIQTEESISQKALSECSLKLLPPKTVLVAMYGQGKTRGQSAILEIEATTNQACFAILPNETWEPDFLHLWFQKSYQELRDLSEDRGGNQANLNGALLKAFEVPAPPKDKQNQLIRKVNSALREIKSLTDAIQTTLTDINKMPSCLLAQAFEQ